MKSETNNYDVLIVGGGIVGLWVAKHAIDAGLSVVVVEKDRVGAGASGGLLGALIPHLPSNWIEKKQFQFEALYDLPNDIAVIEEATGKKAGYQRVGRIMPLREEGFIKTTEKRGEAALNNWHQREETFDFSTGHDERYADWLSPDYAPFGYILDTFAARVHPCDYLDVLKAFVSARGTLIEGVTFSGYRDGKAFLDGHADLTVGQVVLSQGYQTFDFLREQFDLDIGTGIKGQAVSFAIDLRADLPVIFDDGVYIVPHEDGTCGVGSTAEKVWSDPTSYTEADNAFIEKAYQLCPQLRNADIIERWASVRPKCYEREPIIGRLSAVDPIYIATGGFKVSFGIAHRVAKALVEEMTGSERTVQLPESFTVKYHLDKAKKA
ncbi:MAG: FAD-binding oxidoreductase [Hyphomicrobiales bacterium]